MKPLIDVIGVGNAIVDVISSVPESFITQHGLVKGAMTLIDSKRASELYAAMPAGVEVSGGSAANTMVGVASYGGTAAYIGKVRADQLGEVFAHDIRAAGVAFDVHPAASGPPTARSLIQVTPDAERTMNTCLGISALLKPSDIDTSVVASARITYCEGYLWDVQVAKNAIRTAIAAARDAKRTVAMTLSDSYCVNRHRGEWLDLIDDSVDMLFSNEAEARALTLCDDLDAACKKLAAIAAIVVVTRGAEGSIAMSGQDVVQVPAAPVLQIVDLTGAGDLYAAGFLRGLSIGAPIDRCAELATVAASEVISHTGARPLTPLSQLASTDTPTAPP